MAVRRAPAAIRGTACGSPSFGGSPQATHAVDIGATIDRGVASLQEHRTYLDALSPGTTGTDPDEFLRGMAAQGGPRLGVELATTFELIPLG